MNELDKLKLHLNNLKNKGDLEFNINVKYLLDLLETLPTQPEAPKRSNNMDVDGGDFTDG